MTKLEIKNITKTYGSIVALHDFTLQLDKKAFVVVAGPSGCGKTTMLEILAGLKKQDSGSIFMEDKDISSLPCNEREIAMIFQDAALFPHMSAYDNIAYGLTYSGVKSEDAKLKVEQMAEMLSIRKLLTRKAKSLSGGEKQRISIARALVRNPKVFLMDEPLSSLDARLRNQLRIDFIELYQKIDATFFYVTHDQQEAMTMADILIVMKDGTIQQVGKPKEVYLNPANLFTATFLGKYEINQIKGHIREQHLYWKDHRLPLLKSYDNQEIIIAVREQNLYIDNEYGVEGKIKLIEDIGDESYFHIRYEEGTVVMKNTTCQPMKCGDSIRFNFHWRDALLFNEITKERIYL